MIENTNSMQDMKSTKIKVNKHDQDPNNYKFDKIIQVVSLQFEDKMLNNYTNKLKEKIQNQNQ